MNFKDLEERAHICTETRKSPLPRVHTHAVKDFNDAVDAVTPDGVIAIADYIRELQAAIRNLRFSVVTAEDRGKLDALLAKVPVERDPLEIPSEPVLIKSQAALLPTVPAPLRLRHGPILVTLETWSDRTHARLPAAALYGEGETEALALCNLADNMLEFARDMRGINLAPSLHWRWEAFTALVDVSNVTYGAKLMAGA